VRSLRPPDPCGGIRARRGNGLRLEVATTAAGARTFLSAGAVASAARGLRGKAAGGSARCGRPGVLADKNVRAPSRPAEGDADKAAGSARLISTGQQF